MLQNCVNLLPGDAWEPFEKLVNRRAVLKILGQRTHGNARAFKDGASGISGGFSLDGLRYERQGEGIE
jgi:hypothetical protein